MLLGFTVKKHKGLETTHPSSACFVAMPRVFLAQFDAQCYKLGSGLFQLPYVHSLSEPNWVDNADLLLNLRVGPD